MLSSNRLPLRDETATRAVRPSVLRALDLLEPLAQPVDRGVSRLFDDAVEEPVAGQPSAYSS